MKARYLTLLATAILSCTAMAGQVNTERVSVTPSVDGSGSAGGTLAGARFSRNSVEYIGCGLRIQNNAANEIYRWGFCQATNSTGTNGFCMIEDSEILNAISGISDYSYISFSWNTAGICTRIGFSTQSFYIP